MVNVRDLGGIKHTFKLLVYPEPRLFQCANAEAKQVCIAALPSSYSVLSYNLPYLGRTRSSNGILDTRLDRKLVDSKLLE